MTLQLIGGQFKAPGASVMAMNNKGQVVGSYFDRDFTTHAVLWTITWRVEDDD